MRKFAIPNFLICTNFYQINQISVINTKDKFLDSDPQLGLGRYMTNPRGWH